MNKSADVQKYEKEMRELARAWVLLFLEQKGYIHLLGKTRKYVKSAIDINPLAKLNLKIKDEKKR